MSSFFDACYPRTPDGTVKVIPLSSEELHPSLRPYERQLIIPVADIIDTVDVHITDMWLNREENAVLSVLSYVDKALKIWCKNGWRLLTEIQLMTPTQANDMVVEYFKSEYRMETPLDVFAVKIAVALIPMMVTLYQENGYFLDTLQISRLPNGQYHILGGDLVITATYIRAY